MAYTRRDLSKGAAVQTTLNGGISSGATSCVISTTTGWPDGSPGPFYVVVDPGLTTEEKILCSTRSSTTVNFTTRGADGTSAAAHASGAVIYPCVTAVDLDEANLAVAKLIGLATAVGQIPVVDAANSFAMVQAKTSGQIVVGNGTTAASVAVSGDATLAASGALTLANSGASAASYGSTTAIPVLTVDAKGRITAASTAATVSAATLGTLGYAEVTANQSSISTLVDLTSLTTTVTVGASRRIEIIGHGIFLQQTSAGAIEFMIYEGSTAIAEAVLTAQAGESQTLTVRAVLTPSTGSHTYKLRAATSGGTCRLVATAVGAGTLSTTASILVKDIGT